MLKTNKVESFSLERLLDNSNFVSGNAYYHTNSQRHASHIDLHGNQSNGQDFSYRLYNPSGGEVFPLAPGGNCIIRKS